jgi:hypothetical protein
LSELYCNGTFQTAPIPFYHVCVFFHFIPFCYFTSGRLGQVRLGLVKLWQMDGSSITLYFFFCTLYT